MKFYLVLVLYLIFSCPEMLIIAGRTPYIRRFIFQHGSQILESKFKIHS